MVSSPERNVYSRIGSDAHPDHVRELTRAELEGLLRGSFCEVRTLIQRVMLESVIVADDDTWQPITNTLEKRGEARIEVSTGLPRSVYLVAIASDAPIDNVPNGLYIENDEVRPAIDRAAAPDATLAALTTQLEDARSDIANAVRQRDAMRTALRRAAQRVAWRGELDTIRAQQEELDAIRAQLESQVALTNYWHDRYESLRARLEVVLRRFGITLALRVTPSPLRRLVSQRILGPGRS
jgi:hypothetical protein